MNRGELKSRAALTIGVAIGTDEPEETALLEGLANEAVKDILTRTRVHVRRALVPLSSGEDEFEVGSSLLTIWGISRETADSNGDNGYLYKGARDFLDPDEYAIVGFNRIELGTVSSGESLSVWYSPQPTAMSADAHDPSAEAYGLIPAEYHRGIVNYMCWHAADMAGDQGSSRGEKYRLAYEGKDGIGSLGSDLGRIKWSTNTRGGAIRVKRRRQRLRGDMSPSHWQG